MRSLWHALPVDALPIPVDELPTLGDWAPTGGAVGLLAVVVVMILTGRLVPLRFYRQLEADRDQWREVAQASTRHTDQLLPAAKITTDITQALAGATGVHAPADVEAPS